MSVSTSDGPGLRSLKKEGLSTATVYVRGFLGDDGNFDAWLEQHKELESTRGWRSDVFGYQWPSGNKKKIWRWGGFLGTGLGFAGNFLSRFDPRFAFAANLGKFGRPAFAAGGVVLNWLWNYKTAEKNAINLAPHLAGDIERLNLEYEKVRVVAHSLGCRLVVEAAARLPQEYLPSQTWLLAPACREDVLRGRVARERTWLYYTERDWILRYLFPWVSGGKALGAVGPKGSYPGLVAEDVSDRFGFWVHQKYENRFADLVRPEGEVSSRGQQTKVFLPPRERFESRTKMSSNAPRITDERVGQRRRPARKKPMSAGLEAKGQEKRLSDRSAPPLLLTKEWLQAQEWGSRKPTEKTTDTNTIQVVKTSAAAERQEAAQRVMDQLDRQVEVQKTEARQRKELKAPKKKGGGWGWAFSAALTAAALALGIPYVG